MNRFIASCVPACLLLLPLVAVADTNGPPSVSPGPATTLDTIVVTGSYIRRTDTESPSPVTVLNSDEILKQGFNSLADAIRSVTADSSGTISIKNPRCYGWKPSCYARIRMRYAPWP